MSNLVTNMCKWKDRFVVHESKVYMCLLTSISVKSSRGGPNHSLATMKNMMLSSTSCGIESNGVGVLCWSWSLWWR